MRYLSGIISAFYGLRGESLTFPYPGKGFDECKGEGVKPSFEEGQTGGSLSTEGEYSTTLEMPDMEGANHL